MVVALQAGTALALLWALLSGVRGYKGVLKTHEELWHSDKRHLGLCFTCIGGWGVSPNQEIAIALASVILRLAFCSSISAPGRGRALDEFE